MSKFLNISLLLLAILLGSSRASAATITPGPLVITYDGEGSLFSENKLEPGDKIAKTLTVTNNGRIAHNFAMATANISGELADQITLSALEDSKVIWTNTILELSSADNQSKFITSIAAGQTKQVVIEANFLTSAGNNVAGKSVSFDITYGTEESEPVARTLGIFSTNPTPAPSVEPSVGASTTPTASPVGEVKGDETKQGGLNPWYLVIAPAAVIASTIFLPEFLFVGGLAAVGGGVTYVLGYSSRGNMDATTFYIILIAEIILLIAISYFLLHHDNRASRRIKGYKHRLRIR